MRTHLDLFSGIGGFALAAGWAGYTTIGFCEIDPFCHQVLRKHWPEVPIHDDIRTLTADVVGQPIDLLTGGFPCQPFSLAGKQRGADDDRHLWPEMARVIDECRPRWVLGENVDGFINMALDDCLADLESIGYEAWAVVLPACGVGAWHRRNRVWIVAHSGIARREGHGSAIGVHPQFTGTDGAGQADADTTGGTRRGRPSGESGFAALSHEVTPDADAKRLPITEFESREERSTGAGQRSRIASSNGETSNHANELGYLSPENEIRAGWDASLDADWWVTESQLRGVPHGLSTGVDRRAARLKALGNAIVPQVAYEIIREMAA